MPAAARAALALAAAGLVGAAAALVSAAPPPRAGVPPDGWKGAPGPRGEADRYRVGERFSHRRHLARLPGAADPCRACHASTPRSGERVPSPKKEQCRPCHDGRRAFSLVEPACRRCHAPPPREEPSPGLVRERFSHRVHAAARPDLACGACHALDARGAPSTTLRGHAPCADAGCHADDFAAPAPRTCRVCHVRSEPWRDLHAEPVPADVGDFGAAFSHRAHLGRAPARLSAPCTRCHLPAAGGRFQPGPGHVECAGAGCHTAARGGAAPALSSCTACHTLGLADQHELAQSRRRWSVRERFDHGPHAREPSAPGRPLSCVGCHAGALTSEKLGDMPTPRKAACARCHEGRIAFKLTGHGCARCHRTPAAADGDRATSGR